MSNFQFSVELKRQDVKLTELSVRDLRLILKSLLIFESSSKDFIDNIYNLLAEKTNLSHDNIKKLNFIDTICLLIYLKCISSSNVVMLSTDTNNKTTIRADLFKFVEILQNIGSSRVSDSFNYALDKILVSYKEEFPDSDSKRKIIETESVPGSRGFEHFETLITACKNKIPLSFTHYSYLKRKFNSVIVHPVLLKEFGNFWYLLGYSESHKELRTFGFDRIYEPLLLKRKFIPTPQDVINNYYKDTLKDYIAFAKCYGATVEIVETIWLVPGNEMVAIYKTFWLRILQKKIRRWLKVKHMFQTNRIFQILMCREYTGGMLPNNMF